MFDLTYLLRQGLSSMISVMPWTWSAPGQEIWTTTWTSFCLLLYRTWTEERSFLLVSFFGISLLTTQTR